MGWRRFVWRKTLFKKISWGKGQISIIGLPETDIILVILGNEPTPDGFSFFKKKKNIELSHTMIGQWESQKRKRK